MTAKEYLNQAYRLNERIAERLFADRSTVIRWHRKALKNFAVPEK